MIERLARERLVRLNEIECHVRRAQQCAVEGNLEAKALHIGLAMRLRELVEETDRRAVDEQAARDIVAAATRHPSPKPVRLGVKALLASVILGGGTW